jgi:GntR family transcriptional regulator, transcriptional repressor for pyruvate dehydrogenase complex
VVSAADAPAARGLPIIYRPVSTAAAAAGKPRQPKASESTAAAIVRDILADSLQVGDRLPSEAEMLVHYGVSRESLREALRLLEVQGLIAIRRGPGGGPVVSPLNASYLARTAALYFNLSGATYEELFQTWQDLEPTLSEKVARLPDKPLKRRSFAPFLDGADPAEPATRPEQDSFHAVVADLSGNRVLTLLSQAVTHIVVDHVVADLAPDDERAGSRRAHADIARAIVDGRARRAYHLMREHIIDVTTLYRTGWPDRMQEAIEWR